MIYGQTTSKSIELMNQKRNEFLAAEKRLAESQPKAVLDYFRKAELDRSYEDGPGAMTNCTCAEDPHQSHGAFVAFPSDTTQMLHCCVDCGTVHFIGE